VIDAKSQTEHLLQALLPFAEQMLSEHGEFFPFAGALLPSGNIAPVTANDGREYPPSEDVIALLRVSLRERAETESFVASILVYDVRITPPEATGPTDAIAVELEHRSGYVAKLFFPYKLTDGNLKLEPPFGRPGVRTVFSAPN